MSRDQFPGTLRKVLTLVHLLINNGFNEWSYAYCDSCCHVALLDHWKMPKDLPRLDHGIITSAVETQLLRCPARGHFRASAQPRCPHCNEPLDPIRAADYIETNAPRHREGVALAAFLEWTLLHYHRQQS